MEALAWRPGSRAAGLKTPPHSPALAHVGLPSPQAVPLSDPAAHGSGLLRTPPTPGASASHLPAGADCPSGLASDALLWMPSLTPHFLGPNVPPTSPYLTPDHTPDLPTTAPTVLGRQSLSARGPREDSWAFLCHCRVRSIS